MALNSRDSNFPSTSIGRTQGRQIAPPQDPLGAHPLASSLPSDAPNPSQTVPAPPPYVPYTPRQRPATTTASATLNASVSISSSSPSHGEATSRLQLQGLKATVQTVGIDNNSIGWAILEKLVAGEVEGPEWDEIWNVIASGSVTLILPREQVSNGTIMTPEFVRDHVAFCVVPFKESSPLVTLGGLRGFVDGQKISIRTALPTHHKRFLAVKKPSMRAHALLSLPPLYNGFNPEGPFPTFSVSAYLSSLALPSRPTPVALPSVPTRQNPPVTSRLANPFSTLFGSRSSAVPPASVPPRPSSPYPPSIKSEGSLDHPSPYSAEGHIVSAFVVDRKIIRKDVVRASSKALKSTIKMELDGLPMWLPDRILSFTAPLQPFHKSYSLLQKLNDSSSPISTTSNAPPTIVDTESVDAMANSFQDFYDAITHDLERSGSLMEAGLKNRLSSNQDNISAIHSQAGVQDTNIVGSYPEDEAKEIAVKDALERIEECMSKMFYDQMFSPLECDDTSHDEALSSRIAALGILDLGWQHLGVEMDDGETNSESINELVAKCGKILEKLHDRDHHSPRAKAEVLLAVHKEIVEALSSLPPLRLKPENEKMQPEPADFTASHSTRDPSILSTKFREGSEMHQGLIKEAELKQLSPLASPRAVLDKSPLRDDSASIPSQVGINITSESPERAPTKTLSPTKKTPVNTDVILPIIIYSIVKANPIQLVSHLLFIERYRSRKVGGEESYCLVNFLAAVEFLEHVDMQALGLGEADRVMSTHDLSPIPIANTNDPSSPLPISTRLRGRVEQQVGGLANSATKVISGVGGVVDSSFTAIRGLLGPSGDSQSAPADESSIGAGQAIVSALTRSSFGLLRRGASFSVASAVKKGDLEETSGRQLIEVPRFGHLEGAKYPPSEGEHSYDSPEDGNSSEDDGGGDPRLEHSSVRDRSDTRSIRSFSSMLSKDAHHEDKKERISLSERLASMSALSRLTGGSGTPPGSRRTSLLQAPAREPSAQAQGSHPAPIERISPPDPRFLECDEKDLRVGEIPALLADYRRVVTALRAVGGFHE